MFARASNRLRNTIFHSQDVATRTMATQVAAKIDTSTSDNKSSEYSNAAPYESIPGPSALTFVVTNLPGGKYFRKDVRQVLNMMREEHGDLLKLPSVFGKPAIVVTYNPEHFQKLFRTEGAWPNRLGFESMQYFREKIRPDVYGKHQGLINAQGKEWAEFRTAVNPVMIQPKNAKLYIPTINEVANDFLQRIRKLRDPTTNQLPENFEDELNKWTLESIGVIAMDTRLGLISDQYNERGVKFMECVKAFFEISFEIEFKPSLFRIVATPAFNKLMKAMDTMTTISSEFIEEAKARFAAKPEGSSDDHEQSILEKLLRIDPIIAKVMAMDMVLAGVDTTSSAFTAVLYMLAKNSDKQQILREEIMAALPQKDSNLTAETMSRLPYLRACIKEAQRLLPTVNGNVRGAGQDLVLDGYQIPKGTYVAMNGPALQLEDKYYPEANKFLPERWLKQKTSQATCPASAKSAHPFLYLPFGFGPRMCIGRRFAEMEIEILISKIVRNFHVSWEHPDLTYKCTTLNLPDGKLMFTLNEIEK